MPTSEMRQFRTLGSLRQTDIQTPRLRSDQVLDQMFLADAYGESELGFAKFA